MDLFQALPSLRHHPLLERKNVTLIGISTIVRDDSAFVFEINGPRYWKADPDGSTIVSVGGLGGTIDQATAVAACLRQTGDDALGTQLQLEMAPQTYLVNDWQIVETVTLRPSRKRPVPLMVILFPPQLGGPGTPDHLAILAFLTRMRGTATPQDVFGLLRIERQVAAEVFARDQWPVLEMEAQPGFELHPNGVLPDNPILRPALTARAFQALVRAGHAT